MPQLQIGDKVQVISVIDFHGSSSRTLTIDKVTKKTAWAGLKKFHREYAPSGTVYCIPWIIGQSCKILLPDDATN